MSCRDVTRAGMKDPKTASDLNPIPKMLEDRDVVSRSEQPPNLKGGRPKRDYNMNPAIRERGDHG